MRHIEGYVLLTRRNDEDIIYGRKVDKRIALPYENIVSNKLTPFDDPVSAVVARILRKNMKPASYTPHYLRTFEMNMIDRRDPSYEAWFHDNVVIPGSNMEYFAGRKDLVILSDQDFGRWGIYGKQTQVMGIAYSLTSDYLRNGRKPLSWDAPEGELLRFLLSSSARQGLHSGKHLASLTMRQPYRRK